jgi:hypothetical protein
MNIAGYTLFDDLIIETPETQVIKYTGSKLKLLPYILNFSKKITNDSKNAALACSLCVILPYLDNNIKKT